MPAKLAITYSSGLWKDFDPYLASLAVFYDEVALPYPYGHVANGERIWTGGTDFMELRLQETYGKWLETNRPLFDAGILRTLPPPLTKASMPHGLAKDIPNVISEGRLDPVAFYRGDFALAVHAAFAKKPSPEVFIADDGGYTTEQIRAALLTSLLQYQIPVLGTLYPEEILEVRATLRDVKEGFADYIATHVDDVEQRLRNGEQNLLIAANKTSERNLVPWYREMRRQMGDKKTGFWAKFGELAGKFLQIDAAPWTPKFYGGVLELFGAQLGEAAKFETEARSNASCAFQFVSRVERESTRGR